MLTDVAPWVILGLLVFGLVFAIVRYARKDGAAKGDIDDANARADFNRKLADRRKAKDLDELRERARRRRDRE